jgi:hypothetical protein
MCEIKLWNATIFSFISLHSHVGAQFYMLHGWSYLEKTCLKKKTAYNRSCWWTRPKYHNAQEGQGCSSTATSTLVVTVLGVPAHGNTAHQRKKKGNSTVQCIESKSRLLGFDLVYQNFVGGGSQTLESHCIFGYFSSFQQPVAWGLSNTWLWSRQSQIKSIIRATVGSCIIF